MNRRTQVRPHAPTLSRGGGSIYVDEDGNALDLPCTGDPEPWDAFADGSKAEREYALRAIKRLCEDCPIREACWAKPENETWVTAIRDGITTKSRRRPVAACGTESGYTRHVRTLKEPACDACKAAKASAGKRNYKRRQETAA